MRDFDALSIDGKLLRTFLTVFDAQSVTKAADTLGVTQSAVSHSLDRLRECLGDPLFVKKGRGIVATDTARMLAPKMVRILSDIEGLSLRGEYSPSSDQEPFTIATNVTELLPVLLQINKVIRLRSGRMQLRFIELGARANALEVLGSSKADLTITAAIGPYPTGLVVDHLYEDHIVCYFDEEKTSPPQTTEEYCDRQHAILDFGGSSKSIVDAVLESIPLTRNVYLAAANSYALARLATGTDLIATLPKRLEATAFAGFASAAPPFPLPPVRYDVAWHRRMNDSPRNIWLRSALKEAVAEIVDVQKPGPTA